MKRWASVCWKVLSQYQSVRPEPSGYAQRMREPAAMGSSEWVVQLQGKMQAFLPRRSAGGGVRPAAAPAPACRTDRPATEGADLATPLRPRRTSGKASMPAEPGSAAAAAAGCAMAALARRCPICRWRKAICHGPVRHCSANAICASYGEAVLQYAVTRAYAAKGNCLASLPRAV